jgi:hypothetical protein
MARNKSCYKSPVAALNYTETSEPVWVSPANVDVCNDCAKAVDKCATWDGWDYDHHDGATYAIYNDPEKGPVIRYSVTAKQDVTRSQLDSYGTLLHGNVAVRISVRFGRDYKVEDRNGTANFLTTNVMDPCPGHGAPQNTWYLLGNVDMDSNRRLQLFTFRPVPPPQDEEKTTCKSHIILKPNRWYEIELRADAKTMTLQVLLDGKLVTFDRYEWGTGAVRYGITQVPLHSEIKEITLGDLHGGAYGYFMHWSPEDKENWIDNGPIRIYSW